MRSRRRRRRGIAAVACFAASAVHAQDADLKLRRAALSAALAGIRTAAGVSVADRMRACRFIVGVRASSITTETADNAAYSLHPGDRTLFVVFEVSTIDPAARRPEVARWFLRRGRAEPDTAWAREIQLAPFPIHMNRLTRC